MIFKIETNKETSFVHDAEKVIDSCPMQPINYYKQEIHRIAKHQKFSNLAVGEKINFEAYDSNLSSGEVLKGTAFSVTRID